VDATTAVRSIARRGGFVEMAFEAPRTLRRYIVEKGSIALNGVSLTVASLRGGTMLIALIPHTLKMTNLSSLRAGSRVNVEVDILAKYVESLTSRGGGSA
jgi:riboflavin synthase